MQEGSFRCDANVSVRKPGDPLGTRREIKNLNSFKFMQQAIDFEVRWQIEQIEDGFEIQQATVLFDPDTGETRAMRTKEDAADYRYFPDPDLPPLVIGRDWVARVQSEMTELPRVMAARFVADYGLPEYDATTLTQSKAMAAYFEAAAKACGQAKLVSNWVMGEVSRRLNAGEVGIENAPVSAAQLAALKQMNDTGALEAIIDEVLAANPKNVEEFRAGNAKALNGLVGPIMKASKGKANPAQVNELLLKKLQG
jgi:aspartyl-tRNA(Asn)/glutamyl-tRNA(Gln) amidotransferase subunit B